MQQLLGEFECKIDSKGRMRLPSQLLRQYGAREEYQFVINRDTDGCLIMYSKDVFERKSKEINELNEYVKDNKSFLRYFYRGLHEVTLDGSDRLLLTKRLLDYAGITKEVILTARLDCVEIWDVKRYDESNLDPDTFSDLAQRVMGSNTDDEPDEDT